ncbi:hypothetical protein ACU4GD_29770 [Cupriavidus basilensis]
MLVDERAVPPHHADSNARLVGAHLLPRRSRAGPLHPLVAEEYATPDGIRCGQGADPGQRRFQPARPGGPRYGERTVT